MLTTVTLGRRASGRLCCRTGRWSTPKRGSVDLLYLQRCLDCVKVTSRILLCLVIQYPLIITVFANLLGTALRVLFVLEASRCRERLRVRFTIGFSPSTAESPSPATSHAPTQTIMKVSTGRDRDGFGFPGPRAGANPDSYISWARPVTHDDLRCRRVGSLECRPRSNAHYGQVT